MPLVEAEDDIIYKHPSNNCDIYGNKHCIAINSFTSTIFITTPVVYQNAIAGQMCPFFASGCSRKLKSLSLYFCQEFRWTWWLLFLWCFAEKGDICIHCCRQEWWWMRYSGQGPLFSSRKAFNFCNTNTITVQFGISGLHFVVCVLGDWHSMFFVCNSVQLGVGRVIVITVHLEVGRAGIFKESPRNKAVNYEERLLYRPQIWTLNALSLNEVR